MISAAQRDGAFRTLINDGSTCTCCGQNEGPTREKRETKNGKSAVEARRGCYNEGTRENCLGCGSALWQRLTSGRLTGGGDDSLPLGLVARRPVVRVCGSEGSLRGDDERVDLGGCVELEQAQRFCVGRNAKEVVAHRIWTAWCTTSDQQQMGHGRGGLGCVGGIDCRQRCTPGIGGANATEIGEI